MHCNQNNVTSPTCNIILIFFENDNFYDSGIFFHAGKLQ